MRPITRYPTYTFAAIICFAPLGQPACGQDPKSACTQNAHKIVDAVKAYVMRDPDRRLPPMDSHTAFEQALRPFLPRTDVFFCPATKLRYSLNSAVGGAYLFQIPDFAAVQLLQDSLPHSTGKSTVAYLDGFVTYGGVTLTPIPDTVAFARQLVHGVLSYAQDHDGILPPMSDDARFRTAMLPYTRSSRSFDSLVTGRPFRINRNLSDQNIHLFSDRSPAVVMEDPPVKKGDRLIAGYLDGVVERGGVPQPNVNDACRENVRLLVMGAQMFAQDHDDLLPPMGSFGLFRDAVFDYLRASRRFMCPATGLPYAVDAALSGKNMHSFARPDRVAVIQDSQPHPLGGVTVGYLDGHVVRR